MSAKSLVHILRVTGYDKELYEELSKVLDKNTALKTIDSKSTITIKINLCDARPPETGAITHPMLLDLTLKYFRERYGFSLRIYVVESDGIVALPDFFVKWFGFTEIIKKWKAIYLNISKDHDYCIIYKPENYVLKRIPVHKVVFNSDVIVSHAKLKTNSLTKITGCLKNMFGCLPYVYKNRLHPYIDYVIADINNTIKPNVCIIDGIISHVGVTGPALGEPIKSNILLVSDDPVAIDSVAAQLLGFKPYEVKHIFLSWKLRIGDIKPLIAYNNKIYYKAPFSIYSPNRVIWLIYRSGSYLRRYYLRRYRKSL